MNPDQNPNPYLNQYYPIKNTPETNFPSTGYENGQSIPDKTQNDPLNYIHFTNN